MADKNEKGINEDNNNDHSYKKGQCGTTTNEEIMGFTASEEIITGDKDLINDRHNNNARSAAVLESEEYPRINTENL